MARQRKKKITTDDIIQGINQEVEKQLLESSIINKKIKEEIKEEKKEEITSQNSILNIWETDNILSFKDFASSPEHMNFPIISERQLAVAEFMFGDDPKKMFDNERHTCILAWGKGCLVGTHYIVDAEGNVYNLAFSYKQNMPIVLFAYDISKQEVVKVFSTPAIKKEEQEECYLICTQRGLTFKASQDHQFLTSNGWKKTIELKKNDFLIIPLNFNIVDENQSKFQPNRLNRAIAFVYGFAIMSAFMSKKDNICIGKARDIKKIKFIAKKFNTQVKFIQKEEEFYAPVKDIYRLFKRISKKISIKDLFLSSKDFKLRLTKGVLKFLLKNKCISFHHNQNVIRIYEMIRFCAQSIGVILPNMLGVPFYLRKYIKIDKIKKSTPKFVGEKVIAIIPIGKLDVYTFTVPATQNYILGGAIHHNSGKDTISALMQLYIVYVLLNMKVPQNFFGLGSHSSIDLLNIASTREQAQEVYFQLLRRLVLNWRWLKSKYEFIVNGRYFSSPASSEFVDLNNKVVITNECIVFPKNIQMFSGSSEADSSEGKNLICFVLDEADAFKASGSRSAERIYRMCRTSAYSRFKNRAKGFIISYPRSEKGFVLSLYNMAKDDLHFYCDRAATWEVIPHKFSKETFKFNGVDIPIDFYDEFKYDPVGSQLAYMAVPIERSSKFIGYDELAPAFGDAERFIIEFKDFIVEKDEKTVNKDIIYVSPKIPKGLYCISFDLAVKEDNCAVAVSHVLNDKIVVDFVIAWVPDKEKNIKVSLENVFSIVERMAEIIKPAVIVGDTWNSALLCQKLSSKGYNAKTLKITHEDYLIFRKFLVDGNLLIPKDSDLINEIIDLYYAKHDKIDHPEGKHDDRVMACLMGFRALLGLNSTGDVNLLEDGEFISKNIGQSNLNESEMFESKKEGFYIDGIFFPFDNQNVFKKI
jgi:intein/homing endonuclease